MEHPKKLKTQTTISHLLTFTSDPFLYNILMVAGADELMGNSSTKTWYFEWTMMLQKTNIHVLGCRAGFRRIIHSLSSCLHAISHTQLCLNMVGKFT